MHQKRPFKKVVLILKIFALITTHNVVKNNIKTPNCAYYKVVQLKLRCDYSITLIFAQNIYK
jgi:hypothetical protein